MFKLTVGIEHYTLCTERWYRTALQVAHGCPKQLKGYQKKVPLYYFGAQCKHIELIPGHLRNIQLCIMLNILICITFVLLGML